MCWITSVVWLIWSYYFLSPQHAFFSRTHKNKNSWKYSHMSLTIWAVPSAPCWKSFPSCLRNMTMMVNMIATLHKAAQSIKASIPSFHRSLGIYLSEPHEVHHCLGRFVRCLVTSGSANGVEDRFLLYSTFRRTASLPFSRGWWGSMGQATLNTP